ncbi:MAG: hypothetical protein K9H49_06275 [Bacteroidales bacterium]|nr:hypothetical protein [Bacteroidales bacterium]MCF8405058.1 hypothetical protein [Bacteroidales bacterium]
MKYPFLILLLLSTVQLSSQHLAAFNDNVKHFWAFEAGNFIQLEHLEIQEFQVGGTLIAYVDNGSNLKIYQYGEVETLISGSPIKFQATDYLLGYSIYEQLNVFDNGRTKVLSSECDGYEIRDSLIGWHNRIAKTIQVYYNGRIYTIEDGLIYNPLQGYKLGDNTIAYVQRSTKEFKAFYLGKIIVLDDYAEEMVYEAGRDIIAYMDIPDQAFKAFYRGEEMEIETFSPKSFQVGDEMMAWVDNLGRLKLFTGGEIVELSNYEPSFYTMVDKVLIFEEQGYLKTWCSGNVQIIERYIPQPYHIDFNTFAYLDQSSFVKIYTGCESKTISYERVREIDLIRDLVIFTEGINKINIYFNGQIYQH